jgi:hypothetical protein
MTYVVEELVDDLGLTGDGRSLDGILVELVLL